MNQKLNVTRFLWLSDTREFYAKENVNDPFLHGMIPGQAFCFDAAPVDFTD